MARFSGKVAIVTDSGSGIGRATAHLLAGEGAAVTVADLSPDAADAVVSRINGAGGVARPQVVDLNLIDQDVVTMDLETWDRVMAVNLNGPMLGCRFAIPAMLERGGGAIVNTASAAASYGSNSLAAYGTSNAGVVALTRYVAVAYGDAAFVTGEVLRIDGGFTAHTRTYAGDCHPD